MKKIFFGLFLVSSCGLYAQEKTDTVLVNKKVIRNGLTKTVVNSTTTVSFYNKPAVDQASLPVIGTNVSESVAATIKSKYTQTIYDIRKIRGTSGQDVYVV